MAFFAVKQCDIEQQKNLNIETFLDHGCPHCRNTLYPVDVAYKLFCRFVFERVLSNGIQSLTIDTPSHIYGGTTLPNLSYR